MLIEAAPISLYNRNLYNMTNSMAIREANPDGHFKRPDSQFRNSVSADPGAEFPAEKGRYVLYLNLGCPW